MDDLLTVAQAAESTGFTADYIRRLCRIGKIKADKFGTDWMIKPKALKSLKRQRHPRNKESELWQTSTTP